jgi:hypothetical protein
MEREGAPQPDINRGIAIATIGDDDPIRLDAEFKEFLK